MKQNLDLLVHHQAAATTAELLEAAAADMVALLATAVHLLWAVEVASSTSLTFVAPSSALIFLTGTGVLTCVALASLHHRLARYEGSVSTSWYAVAILIVE